MTPPDPDIVRLSPAWIDPLLDMLATVDRGLFHPHPFTVDTLARLVDGKDEYWLLVREQTVVCYGMLRGWEEGFTVPSLGIAVHRDFRRRGLGERMMAHLHVRARERGAARIRLTVERQNVEAQALYAKLGYAEQPDGSWSRAFP